MSEELEHTGSRLEHAIAQTKADIKAIDDECTALQKKAEGLRVAQVELYEVLEKLEAPDVVEEPVVE